MSENGSDQSNAYLLLMSYILDIHRPPLWVIRSFWGNFPRENCKCLSMSGIRQPFFVWCSYRSLSTRGSWWGSVPLRSVFNYFFLCVGQSKRIIQNPIPTCAVPLCPTTGIRLQRRIHKRLYIGNLIFTTPIGMGVDRGVETSLVCRRVARGGRKILFLSPSQRRTPLSAIILRSFSRQPVCSQHT